MRASGARSGSGSLGRIVDFPKTSLGHKFLSTREVVPRAGNLGEIGGISQSDHPLREKMTAGVIVWTILRIGFVVVAGRIFNQIVIPILSVKVLAGNDE